MFLRWWRFCDARESDTKLGTGREPAVSFLGEVMLRQLICAAAVAGATFAAPAIAATTITGGVSNITLRNVDPGLVVYASGINFGPLNLNPGQSVTVPVLTIGTNESSIDFDDLFAANISVAFAFSSPTGVSGAPITGETDGSLIFQRGYVEWDGNGTRNFAFGNGGLFTLTLADASFATPGSATVNGTFRLVRDATPAVPEPATWALMILGFGAVGYSMRRRPTARFAQAV
jgi:hypothetical protein